MNEREPDDGDEETPRRQWVRDLVARLSGYEAVVEVGVGRRPDVAAALASDGKRVTATDIVPRSTPDDVAFTVDDVTNPSPAVYENADVLYAVNLPPELHRPVHDVARAHDADFVFTTLGGDQPEIPVTRETMPSGTLFRARRPR